jgi:tetratricopeptide (TPR) repeat protein
VLSFARQQIEQKFYLPAISTLNTYLENNPKDKDAIYLKAYCLFKTDNYLAAEENYAIVIKLDAKYLPAYVDMANMNVKLKKFNDAIPYFNRAIYLKDSVIDLINSRGMCYYYADKFELAIRDFKRIIQLDSANYLAYNNKGSASYNNQNIAAASLIDLKTAEKDFNKSIELKPDFELAYRNRGVVRFFMDSLNSAYKDLLYATQLEPKDENAHFYLGKLLQKQKKYTVALQFYDNAIKLVNYRAEFYIDRGTCRFDMENYAGARKDFYQALQLTNEKGLIYYQIARLEAAEANQRRQVYL